MRIWVTRSQPGADRTAAKLTALGHEPAVQPVLAYEPLEQGENHLPAFDVLAFTSAHAVRAFATLTPDRDWPVFAVGDETAAVARELGFLKTTSAEGDAEALADLIELKLTGAPKAVLWPRAEEPATDLAALLARRRVACVSRPVYRTVTLTKAPPSAIDGVLIHSARAAQAVARSLTPEAAGRLAVFAISKAAARPLESLPFARVAITSRPDETALLALIAG